MSRPLFELPAALRPLPQRIRELHQVYGSHPGATCKRCRWLHRYQQSTGWMKCERSKVTGGAGSDWRASWPACGLYWEEK